MALRDSVLLARLVLAGRGGGANARAAPASVSASRGLRGAHRELAVRATGQRPEQPKRPPAAARHAPPDDHRPGLCLARRARHARADSARQADRNSKGADAPLPQAGHSDLPQRWPAGRLRATRHGGRPSRPAALRLRLARPRATRSAATPGALPPAAGVHSVPAAERAAHSSGRPPAWRGGAAQLCRQPRGGRRLGRRRQRHTPPH